MTLRLTPEQDERLEALADMLGVSKQSVVSMAIDRFDAAAARQKMLDEAFVLVMTRDKELMERLADA